MGKDTFIPLSEGIVRLSKAGLIVGIAKDAFGREWLEGRQQGYEVRIRIHAQRGGKAAKQVDDMAVARTEAKVDLRRNK